MVKEFHIIDNEDGSTIVFALLILVVLTILGISSATTSTIEMKIVHNEKIYQRNFYQAESATMEAAERIEIEKDTDQLRPGLTNYVWLKDDTIDMTDMTNWVGDGLVNDNSSPSLVSTDSRFATVGRGIAKGSSLDVGASTVHVFSVYGLSQSNNGNVLIEIGYRRRF